MGQSFAYAPKTFPRWEFETVEVEYQAETAAVWMFYKEAAPPYYSLQTIADVAAVREAIRAHFAGPHSAEHPIRYFVMASRRPGVFKLGGDLSMFAEAIRSGERDKLRTYAHACVEVMHSLFMAFDLPIVTLSVVSGQALGGGLEAALAEDYMLADEGATLGVPEAGFNTFPGMGAVSLLSRRLGNAGAEDLISSGRTVNGLEAYDMGLVDLLAPAGQSRETATEWMREGIGGPFQRRLQIAALRRRLFPVSLEELIHITDIWVDCSCDVTSRDVRHMERLAAAQRRNFK
ncbi:MAG: Enoyl-CoA hydratase/isomerase [Caulobacteraceae bacterium]|nr:Enoyl-CoA hydratase/isomerase [Caulobacteraceae bacterium]